MTPAWVASAVVARPVNAVNTLLGNLKTALTGTYHAVKFAKYAYRYLAEVQYRFNRRCDLRSILGRLVRAAVATTPQSEVGIRRAEIHCQSGGPLKVPRRAIGLRAINAAPPWPSTLSTDKVAGRGSGVPAWSRFVMFALAAVAGLLVAAVAFVALTFDAEDFKSLAIERVQREHQRTLVIPGDVSLRFLPRLGVELGAVSLSERGSGEQIGRAHV